MEERWTEWNSKVDYTRRWGKLLRNILMAALALFLIGFGINRVDRTKSMLTSNYLVLNSIEVQNMQEMIKAVQFHIPSFSEEIYSISSSPYENEDGKIEAFLGDALMANDTGDTQIYEFVNEHVRKNFNNNYLFNFNITFLNRDKTLTVENRFQGDGDVEVVKVRDGKKADGTDNIINLITLK